jgi:hypothetical protein
MLKIMFAMSILMTVVYMPSGDRMRREVDDEIT